MKKPKISSFSSGYLPLILAFFLLVIVKILISCYFKSPWIFADETVYAETARNILHGEFYSKLLYSQTYPPGYSLFLSIVYLLFDNSSATYQAMLIINSILSSSIIFPAYFLLKKYCSDNFSILGSVFVAILPSVVLYNFVVLSENLFIPLFAFSLWFLIESFEKNSKKWGILVGFSIFLLFLTRSTSIAMIIGFFFTLSYYALKQLKLKEPAIIVKENIFSVLAFGIPTILWVYYKSKLEITAITDYNLEKYSSTIFQTFSNIQSFTRFLILIIHEVEFLILVSYFVLFVLALYFFFTIFRGLNGSSHDKENQKIISIKSGIIYFLVSSITSIVITVTHMSLGLAQNNPFYSIFGRYIDPIVPIIAIFGLSGLFILLNSNFEKKNVIFLLCTSTLSLIILFVIDFPTTYYKFPNMFSIFYIQKVSTFLPVIQFISLSVILLLIFFIVIVYNKKFWPLFIVFLMIISIIGIYSTLQIQLSYSSTIEKTNQISQYLVKNSNESSRILMMNEDFMDVSGTNMWWGTQFYITGYLIKGDLCTISSKINCQQTRDFDYIISSRILPYHLINASESGYKLYTLEKPENHTIELPYTINIGLNDEEKIENFHSAENNQFRWTKNYSKILIEYPQSCGELNVSLKIGGNRPATNPANVIFLINDHSLGNITYTGNQKIISYTIQDSYLNDYYNILEIDTNTWNPSDYGSKDIRDLGIQVDWVFVQINDLEKSIKYCEKTIPTKSMII
jgi:hypothetical protein